MNEFEPIDLTKLQDFSFRPNWVDDLKKAETSGGEVVWTKPKENWRTDDRGDRGDRGDRRGGGGGRGFGGGGGGMRGGRRTGGDRGDRRGPPPPPGARRDDAPRGPRPPMGERSGPRPEQRGPRPERRDGGGSDQRFQRGGPPPRGGDRRDFREGPPPGLRGWEIQLLPESRSVEAIARQIKASGRAFGVFDVGRLFMDSPDRYVAKFTHRTFRPATPPAKKKPEGSGEETSAPLQQQRPEPRRDFAPAEVYRCENDGSLWTSREAAVRHLLSADSVEVYYRKETITLDPPKGTYTSVAVCGFSGALLGPPNHHDFQRNIARLHREQFANMALDRYKARVRIEKDPELLAKWTLSMTTVDQWTPIVELAEGQEPPAPLKSQAEVENHFLTHHAAAAIVPITEAIILASTAGKMIAPQLRNMLQFESERQKRFPMQLVTILCRELESRGLRFFKRDQKSTYVARTRPHFIPDDLVLSDRIRSIVEMVRANPGITYTRLVSTLAPRIEAKDVKPPAAPPVEEAPAPAAPEGEAPTEAAPTPPAPPAPALSPEEVVILQDLRWLIQEGYVTEFQNGELHVLGRPPTPPTPRKERAPRPKAEPKATPEKTDPTDPTDQTDLSEAALAAEGLPIIEEAPPAEEADAAPQL